MFLTEYDEERTLAFLKKESYDDGVEDGIEIGKEQERESASVEHVIKIMEKFNMQVDEAIEVLDIPEDIRPAIKAEVEKRK